MVRFISKEESGRVVAFLSGNVTRVGEAWRWTFRRITRRTARGRTLAHLDATLARERRVKRTGSLKLPEGNWPNHDALSAVAAPDALQPSRIPPFPFIQNARRPSMAIREELS